MTRNMLLTLCACLFTAQAVSAKPFPGPFTLNDGLTFYFVNSSGGAFDLHLRYFDARRESFPRPALVRVFDPAENLVLRHEFAGEPMKPVPWDEITLPVPGADAGVYEVIVTGWSGGQVAVTSNPEMEFGVFGHLQWLTGTGKQFEDSYVYLPPGLRKLLIEASDRLDSLTLKDEAGAVKLHLDRKSTHGVADLPASGEHIWRLSATGPSYRLDFTGLPIILCPSEAAARAIHASVDVMADGTICFHKFQVAAWKLLQAYRRRPAADYTVPLQPLAKFTAALLKEPARNQLLFTNYGVMSLLQPILAEQQLDPASPWFGAIRCWKDDQGKPRRDNPLADYNRDGRDEFANLTKDLAALYWLKADFNPYYHNPHLLNRIIVGELLDMMLMKEGEYFNDSNTYYYGIHAFTLCHSHSGAFSLVYKDVPADVQHVWHAEQQRVTDRFIYGSVATTNQWTILLIALWRYYEGTGEDWYRQAILRNAHWLTNGTLWGVGQRPAGYMTEASGPDATYNGITGHNLAYLYHQTKDPQLLEALRKVYYLFNHTIAVEPDGSYLGSSGFCHRTPGDWTSPQYGAGLGVMADDLPEAGVRFPDHTPWAYPRPAFDAASRQLAEEQLRKTITYLPVDHFGREAPNAARAVGAFDIWFYNWRYYTDNFLPGRLPCQEKESFTRDFGDEFLCVKRPAYYTFLFGAVDYGEWQQNTRPKEYDRQFPHNDGLCLFWSPQFGVSLLSKNWGAGQANTLLAELPSGAIEWPWYWDTKHQFDTAHATATLTGKIHGTPLAYERRYRFLDDRVECSLKVTASDAVTLKSLSECLPYPTPDVKPGGLQVELLDAAGAVATAGTPAKALFFTNNTGEGHLVLFSSAVAVRLGQNHSVDHYGGQHDWGQALIALPAQWQKNQQATISYAMMPCRASAAGVRVRQAQ